MNSNILLDDLTVGEKVRYYRQKRNFTQRQLAKWAGCSVGVISRLERHNSIPSADILLSICRELKVPPVYIFKNTQRMIVMCLCEPGRTGFTDNGNMVDFELIGVCADVKADKNKYFCVLYNNRYYLALKDDTENCDLYLCMNCFDGKSFITTSSDIMDIPSYNKIVAGLVCDITQLCSTVSM